MVGCWATAEATPGSAAAAAGTSGHSAPRFPGRRLYDIAPYTSSLGVGDGRIEAANTDQTTRVVAINSYIAELH